MEMALEITAPRDPEGYLVDPDDWTPEIGLELAAEEGVGLNPSDWEIIGFMRDYWREHQVAPDVRHVVDHLIKECGEDKRSAKDRLFRLFPYGYVQQACKIAGMMRPRAWSTG
jgi:tRNA 2-thiouridine synthesizing protein E